MEQRFIAAQERFEAEQFDDELFIFLREQGAVRNRQVALVVVLRRAMRDRVAYLVAVATEDLPPLERSCFRQTCGWP